MKSPRHSLLRDFIAVVIAAVACPVSVFGGMNLGCVGQTFSSECAMSTIAVSPVILLASGVIAGVVTRGWTGFLLVFVGTVIGMTSILVLATLGGTPVPFDPISGFIATIWFFAPIAIGFGFGRLLARLWASRSGDQPGR